MMSSDSTSVIKEEAKQEEGVEIDKKGDHQVPEIVEPPPELNPTTTNETTNSSDEVDNEKKKKDEDIVVQLNPESEKVDKYQKEQVYCVKWIDFNNKSVPIILQNENGPCPLIAIANILFLKQIIKFSTRIEFITSVNLIEYLGDALIRSKPANMKEDLEMNFNENFSDALNLLHKLERGLDVNVKFTCVNEFEYTRELNIFDMFNINIYHGMDRRWL